MEVFRYSTDTWGQSVLSGVSWDLLGVFLTAAVAFIVVHALFMWRFSAKK